MTPPLTEIIVEAEAWTKALPDLAEIADDAAREAFAGAGQAAAGQEIAVLACADARIAELNRQFRGKAAATNVLSWPAHPLAPPAPGEPPPAPAPGFLGDLAIAYETCTAEAGASGLCLKDHVFHLILHGCLHLLGYDHETEADARLMEGIERRQLTRRGLHDPYSEGDAA
ncbi:MAG: rRNA maturation RNase YbeY [Pseudomonadota bacterium]